ncbi:aldo/keto reductase [Microbacterium sp. ZW T5_56]|uniref:aldo/keto reductase n=1 Tax=Microbacterium sp. ZW T5_56 TaxID=3378081 RepID=UPI0038543574
MAFRPALMPLRTEADDATLVGLGCAPFGNLFSAVDDDQCAATVSRAIQHGVRFFDTAPHYGAGESERRLGRALADVPRDRVCIATKVGRQILTDDERPASIGAVGASTGPDLSADGVLRSVEGSLRRLGTDRIDLLYLHDPMDVDEALRTAMPALDRLRAEGVVRAIGVGMVWPDPLTRFVRESDPDVVMIAGRTTLLDRTGESELLPAARARDVGVIAAGVFNSGILVDPIGTPYFDYRQAPADMQARARRMAQIAADAGVRLSDAAVRYALRLAGVDAVVVGARTPDEVDAFVASVAAEVPELLWDALARV